MKKLISLLLVLALSLSLLAGLAMAADKPDESTEADAQVKVTDGEGNKYFFPVLSNDLLAWAMKELPGDKTLTVLKDITLDPANGKSNAAFLELPAGYSYYAGDDGHKNYTTLDLSGHTLEFTGEGALISMYRYGMGVKNGTIIYNGTTGRSCFSTGSTTGQVAFSNGKTAWSPIINLEDLTVINNSASGYVMINNVWNSQITIKNCRLISVNGKSALNLYASDQSKIPSTITPYEGDYTGVCTIENSVIASNKAYAFAVKRDEMTLKLKDSLFVSNGKTTALYDAKSMPMVEGDITELGTKTFTVADRELTGNTFVVGKNPVQIELPFTDVKEGDWFYSFVSEMYSKKIINGMTETTFVPNGTLTYGQALKLIAMGLGEAEQPAGAHWASGYLMLAKERGWLATDVDLNGPVTRLAFCQIAAKAKGLTEKAENPFKDTNDDSVLALVKAGVISGMSADTFAPNATLTRAQIAKIISLLIKL